MKYALPGQSERDGMLDHLLLHVKRANRSVADPDASALTVTHT